MARVVTQVKSPVKLKGTVTLGEIKNSGLYGIFQLAQSKHSLSAVGYHYLHHAAHHGHMLSIERSSQQECVRFDDNDCYYLITSAEFTR